MCTAARGSGQRPVAQMARRHFKRERLDADLVVVGGGMAGTCCAITAARAGARVVLLQDRPVLGGNASSEVRVFVIGSAQSAAGNNRWAREGGVVDELLVENTYRNPAGNPVIFDTVLLEKVVEEQDITLLLNTAVLDVEVEDDRLRGVRAFCSQSSTMYEVTSPLFCDASGDGVVGFLAGAEFRMGAESRDEHGEGYAPSEEYGDLLGHSLFFYTKDAGEPVRFVAPSYALDDLATTRVPDHLRTIQKLFRTVHHGCLLNWIEFGGRLDTVHDSERIKWQLWKVAYGVWDHLKNSGEFPEAENLTLEWIGHISGKRESRRFEGLYTLRQSDVIDQAEHDDGVACGGWPIDLHPADGIFSEHPTETLVWPRGVYQVPYRCLVSRDIANLFFAGRLISASHVALASTRVMATCANVGQAVGVAAAICAREGLDPAALLAPDRMLALRRALLRTGQHIPGVRLDDPSDLVQQARVVASSELVLGELPADGPPIALSRSHAQLLPLRAGRLPRVTFTVDVKADTTLRLEARAARRPDGYTPEVLLGEQIVRLAPGAGQRVTFDVDVEIERDCYVFFCVMANEHVAVRASTHRTTGLMAVYHRATQERDERVDRPGIELWNPLGGPSWGTVPEQPHGRNLGVEVDPPLQAFGADSVRNGYGRPTSSPNAWVAAADDAAPSLSLRWERPRRIARVDLTFDPDFDNPLLSVIASHPEPAMPFCVKHYRLLADGRPVAERADNHQARDHHLFEPPLEVSALSLEVLETRDGVPAALFELSCHESSDILVRSGA